tara:strand:- start:960 stop:1631 length:672 start_codon:yes stop_codon:yes gene_type:complete
VNAAELTADEILILRDTDEVASAVAHLAAARLYALMTSDAEEPGVDFGWFDRLGEFANMPDAPEEQKARHQQVQQRIFRLAAYVRGRDLQSTETLYRHDGGRDWPNETEPYRQALEVFRLTALSVASGMETRRAALADIERQEIAKKQAKPLKLEDSIFEPEDKMGDLLPHAVQADQDAAKARRKAEQETEAETPAAMSVGEPPAGHQKAKTQRKTQKPKKSN